MLLKRAIIQFHKNWKIRGWLWFTCTDCKCHMEADYVPTATSDAASRYWEKKLGLSKCLVSATQRGDPNEAPAFDHCSHMESKPIDEKSLSFSLTLTLWRSRSIALPRSLWPFQSKNKNLKLEDWNK